jgi:AraC-like DNA-binding protein
LGLDVQPLLRRARLSRSALRNPEQRIPMSAVITLLEESARSARCETFGLRMAEGRRAGDLGPVSLSLLHQHTLRDALRTFIRHRHLINESVALRVEPAGRLAIVRLEVVTESGVASRQTTELAIAVLFQLCAALLGQKWRPRSIHFIHAAPADLSTHERFFRCRIHFNAEFNGLMFPAILLDLHNPAADPAMARHADRFVESLSRQYEPSIELEIRRAIYTLLPSGGATIHKVAESLGIGPRTLQRRLDGTGCTFSDLLTEVRRDLVERYLDNSDHSLKRVGELLGYARPSAFSRWFSSQFGMAPARWRASRKVKPARTRRVARR